MALELRGNYRVTGTKAYSQEMGTVWGREGATLKHDKIPDKTQ